MVWHSSVLSDGQNFVGKENQIMTLKSFIFLYFLESCFALSLSRSGFRMFQPLLGSGNGQNLKNDLHVLDGLPDAVAFAGQLFTFHIHVTAFYGQVNKFDVYVASEGSSKGAKDLPEWLYFNQSNNLLVGVPTQADTGTVIIQVDALGAHGETADTSFVLQIRPASLIRPSTLAKELGSRDLICAWYEETIEANIVLGAEITLLSAENRVILVRRWAKHISHSPHALSLKAIPPFYNEGSSQTPNGNKTEIKVLSEGFIQANTSAGNHRGLQLSWIISCGSFDASKDVARILDHAMKSGALQNVLGYPVVGWFVSEKLPVGGTRTLRKKRQVQEHKVRGRSAPSVFSYLETDSPYDSTTKGIDSETSTARSDVDTNATHSTTTPSPIIANSLTTLQSHTETLKDTSVVLETTSLSEDATTKVSHVNLTTLEVTTLSPHTQPLSTVTIADQTSQSVTIAQNTSGTSSNNVTTYYSTSESVLITTPKSDTSLSSNATISLTTEYYGDTTSVAVNVSQTQPEVTPAVGTTSNISTRQSRSTVPSFTTDSVAEKSSSPTANVSENFETTPSISESVNSTTDFSIDVETTSFASTNFPPEELSTSEISVVSDVTTRANIDSDTTQSFNVETTPSIIIINSTTAPVNTPTVANVSTADSTTVVSLVVNSTTNNDVVMTTDLSGEITQDFTTDSYTTPISSVVTNTHDATILTEHEASTVYNESTTYNDVTTSFNDLSSASQDLTTQGSNITATVSPSVVTESMASSETSENPTVISSTMSFSGNNEATTAPSTSATTISTNDVTTSASQMSTQGSELTTTVFNSPPEVVQTIGRISTLLGTYFEFSVPAETFHDAEEGNSRHLHLQLLTNLWEPVASNSWVLLNTTTQLIYGLAMDSEMAQRRNTSVILVDHLWLQATDQHGANATLSIELGIDVSSVINVSHKIIVEFRLPFRVFRERTDTVIEVSRMLSEYFNDDGSSDVTVTAIRNVNNTHVLFIWTNNTISKQRCDNETIMEIYNELIMDNLENLQGYFGDFYPLNSVELIYDGVCLVQGYIPPPKVSKHKTNSGLPVWVVILLVSIIVLLSLTLIIVLIWCCCYRRKDKGRYLPQDDEKPIVSNNRKPVIMADDLLELHDSPVRRPRKPMVLDIDTLASSPFAYGNAGFDGSFANAGRTNQRSHPPRYAFDDCGSPQRGNSEDESECEYHRGERLAGSGEAYYRANEDLVVYEPYRRPPPPAYRIPPPYIEPPGASEI